MPVRCRETQPIVRMEFGECVSVGLEPTTYGLEGCEVPP